MRIHKSTTIMSAQDRKLKVHQEWIRIYEINRVCKHNY